MKHINLLMISTALLCIEGTLSKTYAIGEGPNNEERGTNRPSVLRQVGKSTELHKAASEHNVGRVEQLLRERRPNMAADAPDENGWTPLHIAAEKNDWEILKRLVYGKSPSELEKLLSVRNSKGDTPFHIAAFMGHVDILTRLLELYNGGKNLKGYNGFTPLHTVVSEGRIDLVKFLHKTEGVDIKSIDGDERNVLHLAQSQRNNNKGKNTRYDQIIQYLSLEAPELVGMYDKNKNTPLHYAILKSDIDQLKVLLQTNEAKTFIEYRNKDNDTPLYISIMFSSENITEFLIESGSNSMASVGYGPLLHTIASYFPVDSLKRVCKKDKVNWRDSRGYTPLHEAVAHNKLDNLEYLIEQGADPNARTNTGHTPLHLAVLNKKSDSDPTKVINYLLTKGADPNARGQYGGTILHCAAALGFEQWEWAKSFPKFKDAAAQADDYNKRPLNVILSQKLDTVKLSSQLPQGKQMTGNTNITHDDWQLALYFTTSNPLGKLGRIGEAITCGHGMIVFEGMDIDNDLPSKRHFTIAHLFREDGPTIINSMTAEEVKTNYFDKYGGRNVFKWQIKKEKALTALKEMREEKNNITWELTGKGTGRRGHKIIHSCVTYVFSILDKCGIQIPDKGHRFLGYFFTEDGVVEALKK